jgi:hypothetical protein
MADPLVTIKEMDWWESPLVIKGGNQGVLRVAAEYLGETYNIVDFLNYSLQFEYSLAYDKILDKYEILLKTDNIFEYGYPEIEAACRPQEKTVYECINFPTDAALVEALLKEYEKKIKDMERNIARWDTAMRAWYTRIQKNPYNA